MSRRRARTGAARHGPTGANPPYHRWVEQWPPVADALLAATEASGAVLVVMGNLYVYGPVDGPMTEDIPLAASGTGLVVPMLRELGETRYQFTRPYVLDSSAATATFGLEPTPLEQTFADTVAWWRGRTPVTRG